jgi:hypothetical protein
MKFIIVLLAWLMAPIAFIVVAFDIAKAFVEAKFEAAFEEKTK